MFLMSISGPSNLLKINLALVSSKSRWVDLGIYHLVLAGFQLAFSNTYVIHNKLKSSAAYDINKGIFILFCIGLMCTLESSVLSLDFSDIWANSSGLPGPEKDIKHSIFLDDMLIIWHQAKVSTYWHQAYHPLYLGSTSI